MGLGIKEKIEFMNTLIKLSAAGYDKKDVDRYLEMLETSPSVIDGAATVTEENVEKITYYTCRVLCCNQCTCRPGLWSWCDC